MDLLQIVILAIVQGLTEFLPISSSAHLILVPRFLGWQDQGIAFDVAVHIGTLSAVLWYFRHELIPLYQDWQNSLRQRKMIGDSMLAWGVLLGTIPVGLAGLLISDYMQYLRTPLLIASTTIIFGLLLWYGDSAGKKQKSEHQLTILHILAIGLAQAIALIPGTSRSGITITMALLLGYTRTGAARFSFLLSIPIILGAGIYQLTSSGYFLYSTSVWELVIGFVASFAVGLFAIRFLLKFLRSNKLYVFVIYRLVLAFILGFYL